MSNVPEDIEGGPARSDSPVSGITTPSTGTSRNHWQNRRLPGDADRIDQLTLEQLADPAAEEVCTPLKRLPTALEEEDYHDRLAYNDNPGAEDSENEDEGLLIGAGMEAAEDRRIHEDDNIVEMAAAPGSDYAEYIAAYARQVVRQENEAREAEANNTLEETCDLPGAPSGWKPPGPRLELPLG